MKRATTRFLSSAAVTAETRLRTHVMRAFAAAVASLVLASCASDPATGDARKLELSLSAYHSALRWEGVDKALALHDPEALEKHPVSAFELERWRQFRVVGYRDSAPVPIGTGRVQHRVLLELINVNTQSVRNVIDAQEWRYDLEDKRWWLTSGLPSLDER